MIQTVNWLQNNYHSGQASLQTANNVQTTNQILNQTNPKTSQKKRVLQNKGNRLPLNNNHSKSSANGLTNPAANETTKHLKNLSVMQLPSHVKQRLTTQIDVINSKVDSSAGANKRQLTKENEAHHHHHTSSILLNSSSPKSQASASNFRGGKIQINFSGKENDHSYYFSQISKKPKAKKTNQDQQKSAERKKKTMKRTRSVTGSSLILNSYLQNQIASTDRAVEQLMADQHDNDDTQQYGSDAINGSILLQNFMSLPVGEDRKQSNKIVTNQTKVQKTNKVPQTKPVSYHKRKSSTQSVKKFTQEQLCKQELMQSVSSYDDNLISGTGKVTSNKQQSSNKNDCTTFGENAAINHQQEHILKNVDQKTLQLVKNKQISFNDSKTQKESSLKLTKNCPTRANTRANTAFGANQVLATTGPSGRNSVLSKKSSIVRISTQNSAQGGQKKMMNLHMRSSSQQEINMPQTSKRAYQKHQNQLIKLQKQQSKNRNEHLSNLIASLKQQQPNFTATNSENLQIFASIYDEIISSLNDQNDYNSMQMLKMWFLSTIVQQRDEITQLSAQFQSSQQESVDQNNQLNIKIACQADQIKRLKKELLTNRGTVRQTAASANEEMSFSDAHKTGANASGSRVSYYNFSAGDQNRIPSKIALPVPQLDFTALRQVEHQIPKTAVATTQADKSRLLAMKQNNKNKITNILKKVIQKENVINPETLPNEQVVLQRNVSAPKVIVPRLDLTKVTGNEPETKSGATLQQAKPSGKPSELMKSKLSLNLSALNNNNQNKEDSDDNKCFQDEFMANLDEFSESWRAAALREQRF